MSKKLLLPLPTDLWVPAKFVRNKRECYILFYQTDPITGIRVRFRPTHDLNRIKDTKHQDAKAREIVAEINKRLPLGYPYEQTKAVQLDIVTIEAALRIAMDIKRKKIKNDKSYNSYEVQKVGLTRFCWERGLLEVDVKSFDRSMAFQYIDFIQEANGVKNRTVNNYIIIVKSLFNVLMERGLISENPFSRFQSLKTERRYRREFNDFERRIVAKYISEHDPLLFLAVLMVYYCFLRPKDIRHLRFGQIDMKKQLIFTPAGTSKNAQDKYVTIPEVMLAYMILMPELERFPQHYYVFGENGLPGLKKIGANTINYRHRKVLEYLEKESYLDDISGLSLYSWKYTGNQALFDMNINLRDIQRQNRHHSITVTEIYAEQFAPENKSIRDLRHDIQK